MTVPLEGAPRAHSRPVLVVAIVVAVVAAVLSGLEIDRLAAGSSGSAPSPLAAGATTALTEGGQLAVDFTSFNYQTLQHDFQATAAHATPTFRKTYLAQSRPIASLIRKGKVVSTSQVVATGLQSYTPATGTKPAAATVIVALNDTTKNTKSPNGSVQYFRMQVQMVRQGNQWLASGVTPQ